MATKVTNTTVKDPFLYYEMSLTAATKTTAGGDEKFEITPTAADSGALLVVANRTASTGALTVSFNPGDFWYSDKQSAKTATVAAGKTAVFSLESGFVKTDSGKITVTLTPASSGDNLVSLAAAVGYIEKA